MCVHQYDCSVLSRRGLQHERSDNQFIFALGTQDLFFSSRSLSGWASSLQNSKSTPNAINSVGEKGKTST